MNWFKRLFCRHNGGISFVRNIYGDEILSTGKRSVWRCKRCERPVYLDEFNRQGSGG